jgi:hypothetical protein
VRRLLTLALLSALTSTVLVAGNPDPADAFLRYCRTSVQTPHSGYRAGYITFTGKTSCWGSGTAVVGTECTLQRLQGLGSRLRWVDQEGARHRVRNGSYACSWTQRLEPGQYRARARTTLTGPDVVKRRGWHQSRKVTCDHITCR